MPSIPPMLTSDKDGHEIHFQPPYLGPTSERGRYMNTRTGGELEERSPSIPTTLRRTSSASPPCHADEFSATETERIVNQNPNIFAGTTESQWQALLRPANLSTDELEDAVRTAALKALHGINGIETADGYSRSNSPSYQRKNISTPHGSTPKSVSSPPRLSLIERATVEMKATREARLASAAVHAAKLKEEAEAQKAKSTKEWSNRQPTPVKPFATTVHQSTASSSERALSRGQRKASPVVFYDRSYPTALNVGAAPSGTQSPRIAAQKASVLPTKGNVPTISTNTSQNKESEPTSTAPPIEQTAVPAPSPSSAAKRSFTRRPLYEDPLQRLIAQTAKTADKEKLLATSKARSQSKGDVGQTSIAVQQNRKVEPLSSLERQLKAMAVQGGSSYLSPSLAALLAAVGHDGAFDDPIHASKRSVSVVSTTANLPESLPWGPLCASLFIIATLYPSITMERLKMGTSATMAIKKALADVAESPERKRNPLPLDADATSLLPTIPPSEEKEVARAVAAELLATYEGKHQQLFALLCKRNSAAIETVLKDVCEDLRNELLLNPTESPPHDDAPSSYKKPWDKRNLLHVVDMVLHLTMPTAEYAALIEQLSASVLAHKRTKNWPSVRQIYSGDTPRKVSVGSHTSSKITPKRSGSLTTRSASAPRNSSSNVNTTKIAAGEIRPSIYPSLNTSARVRGTSPSPQPLRGGSTKAPINPFPSLSTVLAGPHAHYSSQHHLYPLRFPTIIPLVIPSYTELGLSGMLPSATRKLAERFGGLVREQLREITTMRPDHGEGSSKEASPEVEAVEIILDGDGELGGEKEEPEVRPITEAVEAIHIAHHPPPVHNEAVTESSPVMSDTERLAEEW